MLDLIQIGKQLKYLREHHAFTQNSLAEKLFVSHQAVSKWENGLSLPSLDTLVTLTAIYDVSIDTLLCLNKVIDTPLDDIFKAHSRNTVIIGVASGDIAHITPQDIIHLLSETERYLLLDYLVNQNRIDDLVKLIHRLSYGERRHIINQGIKLQNKPLLQAIMPLLASFEKKLIMKAGVV